MAKLIKTATEILPRLKKGEEVEVKSVTEARRIAKSLRANSILGTSYEKLIKGSDNWVPYVFICVEPKPLSSKALKALEAGDVPVPKKKPAPKIAKEPKPKKEEKLTAAEIRRAEALERTKNLF